MTEELRDRIAELLELLRPATPIEAADAILALPGIAVVELPEPDWEDENGFGWSTSAGIYASNGVIYDENDSFSPDLARTVGAEWLAAADYAERAP